MSNRLSKEKATAIAREYCTNDHKKRLAMITVGYSPKYASTGEGLRTFDNPLVKQAIAEIEAKAADKAGMTLKRMHEQYDEDRQFARKCKQPSAAVSASTGIARLYGMDKVKHEGLGLVIPTLDETEREAYREAGAKFKVKLRQGA